MKMKPEEYLEADGKHKKFGGIDDIGIIVPPNRLTLKWIPNYYFKLNEKQSVMVLYSFTISFCLIGLIIF